MIEGILQAVNDLNLAPEHQAICLYVVTHVGVLLQFIQRGIPLFTDHGIMHSRRILENLIAIIKGYSYNFTSEDRLILALAAILHDIGCIAGRTNHNENSIKILAISHFSSIRDMLTAEAYRFLEEVILSHSSNYDFSSLMKSKSADSRLAVLCSLFRLADECDVSSERIPLLVLDVLQEFSLLDESSLSVWTSHLEIEKVLITGHEIDFRLYDEEKGIHWVEKLRKEMQIINDVLTSYAFPLFSMKVTVVPRSRSQQD